jgi:trigger factor
VVQDYAASYAKAGGGRTLVLPVPRQAAEVESLVLEDNVVQWVLSQVKVEDKAADFDELMGNAKSKS